MDVEPVLPSPSLSASAAAREIVLMLEIVSPALRVMVFPSTGNDIALTVEPTPTASAPAVLTTPRVPGVPLVPQPPSDVLLPGVLPALVVPLVLAAALAGAATSVPQQAVSMPAAASNAADVAMRVRYMVVSSRPGRWNV
ncbi:hypothetical protein WL93_19705 [Burkholderia diffusa]|nr:hypothetical protein WL93_19705 [Burkholderia diffusa]